MKKIVLIDGNALIHRAYHAYPTLTTSSGELVNAVYGFLSILLNVLNQINPQYAAVTFDKKAPTFRHKEYKKYKSHRPKMDKELVQQIGRVHEAVTALKIPIFSIDGFEADDVIGTLAQQIAQESKDLEVLIVTGDYDTLQLVTENVKVLMPARGKKPSQVLSRQAVLDKYGFEPVLIPDYKGLAGDQSDGIPGVSGIGPKTAMHLIKEYQAIEKIYKNLTKIPEKIREKLKKDKKNALMSKKLATIVKDVPLKIRLKDCCLLELNNQKTVAFLEKMEFRSLIKRLSKERKKIDKKPMLKKDKKNNQMGLF